MGGGGGGVGGGGFGRRGDFIPFFVLVSRGEEKENRLQIQARGLDRIHDTNGLFAPSLICHLSVK